MEIEKSVQRALQLRTVLSNFIEYVDKLKNDGDGFKKEFMVIRDLGVKAQEENTYPAEEGKKQYNVKKNRYKNILPFDATRVVLEEIPGEPGSDYINASFIKDQFQNICYIVTQGPMQSWLYDFWRMIVQYKVKVITMACKLVEIGKKKCDQYWPAEVNETVQFRDISVTLMAEKEMTKHCTKRFMKVVKDGSAGTVIQFHYTGWLDHDIPNDNDFDVILEMIAEMREIKAVDTDKAAMVIHCSAGCGRTGTICAIDYAWDTLKSGNVTTGFNLLEIIKEMRTQRQSIIQTPEQYMMAYITVQKLFQKHIEIMQDHTYGNVGDEGEELYEIKGDVADTVYEMVGAENVPQKKSHLLNEAVQPLKMVTSLSLMHEVSPEYAILIPESELGLITKKTIEDTIAVFQTEKIKNIPYPNKVEQKENNKTDKHNKVSSYISSDKGKEEFKAKMAMFDNAKLPLKPKNALAGDSSKESQCMDPDNVPTTAALPLVNLSTPLYWQLESPQEQSSGKFKNTIFAGDLATKQPVCKSLPITIETLSSTQKNSLSKTLTDSGSKDMYDHLHSKGSISPVPEQLWEGYSTISSSGGYSTSNKTHSVPLNPLNTYCMADSGSDKTHDIYSYSAAYYSSTNETATVTGSHNQQQCGQYSFACSPAAVTESVTTLRSAGDVVYSLANEDLTYSYATNDGCNAETYACVKRSKTKPLFICTNEHESVAIGDQIVPQVPEKKYEDPSLDKLGHGDLSALLKKPNIGNIIEILLHQSKGRSSLSTPEHILEITIPGFKTRLGRKPVGPRQQPVEWQKK